MNHTVKSHLEAGKPIDHGRHGRRQHLTFSCLISEIFIGALNWHVLTLSLMAVN